MASESSLVDYINADSGADLLAVAVTIDCSDPHLLADFWQEAIGFRERAGDGDPYVTLWDARGGATLNILTLQRVPEPKICKLRGHLDLFVRDLDDKVARLQVLGATMLTSASKGHGSSGFRVAVLADPEGGEFCVVSPPD
ncbi:MAG: VOC family protein [bacterium]|nr:VOC family protein [bacterium]